MLQGKLLKKKIVSRANHNNHYPSSVCSPKESAPFWPTSILISELLALFLANSCSQMKSFQDQDNNNKNFRSKPGFDELFNGCQQKHSADHTFLPLITFQPHCCFQLTSFALLASKIQYTLDTKCSDKRVLIRRYWKRCSLQTQGRS